MLRQLFNVNNYVFVGYIEPNTRRLHIKGYTFCCQTTQILSFCKDIKKNQYWLIFKIL